MVALAAIVPGDKTAPKGSFTTSPGNAWKGLTPVNVTQAALSDDFSRPRDVLRWIQWGDGGGRSLERHGDHQPRVRHRGHLHPAGDPQGRGRQRPPVDAQAVTVNADTVAPVVKIAVPKTAVPDEVGSWKKPHGKATDANGTGVDPVSVRAIEKRATGWYFYQATAKTWVKVGTKTKAWSRAKAAVADPTSKGAWTVRIVGLKKGTLFVRATATDLVRQRLEAGHPKAVLTAL